MANSPDANAFDILSAPVARRGAEFESVAAAVRGIRAISGFLKDYRNRYLNTPLLDDNDGRGAEGSTQQARAAQTDDADAG